MDILSKQTIIVRVSARWQASATDQKTQLIFSYMRGNYKSGILQKAVNHEQQNDSDRKGKDDTDRLDLLHTAVGKHQGYRQKYIRAMTTMGMSEQSLPQVIVSNAL